MEAGTRTILVSMGIGTRSLFTKRGGTGDEVPAPWRSTMSPLICLIVSECLRRVLNQALDRIKVFVHLKNRLKRSHKVYQSTKRFSQKAS